MEGGLSPKDIKVPLFPPHLSKYFHQPRLVNIGVIVECIEHSQLLFDFMQTTLLLKKKEREAGISTSISIFAEHIEASKLPFPVFNLAELEGFYGTVISFHTRGTVLARDIPNIGHIYHYFNDLEWTRPRHLPPRVYHNLLNDKKITCYCRGPEHAAAWRASFNVVPRHHLIRPDIFGIMMDSFDELNRNDSGGNGKNAISGQPGNRASNP